MAWKGLADSLRGAKNSFVIAGLATSQEKGWVSLLFQSGYEMF